MALVLWRPSLALVMWRPHACLRRVLLRPLALLLRPTLRPSLLRLRSLTRLVGVRPRRLLPPIRRLLLTELLRLPLPGLLRLPVPELLRLPSMLCPRRRELLRVLSGRLLRRWRTLILLGLRCGLLRGADWRLSRLLLARVRLSCWPVLHRLLCLGKERRPLLRLLPLARLLLRRRFLLRLLLRRPNLLRPPHVRLVLACQPFRRLSCMQLVVVCLSRGRMSHVRLIRE